MALSAQDTRWYDWWRLALQSERVAAEREAREASARVAAELSSRQRAFADAWNRCVVALGRGEVDRRACREMYRTFDRLERTEGWPSRGMVK